MTQRTVTLCLTNEDMITIADYIGSWSHLREAIGYLSTWNLSYPTVTIFKDAEPDLTAIYFDKDGKRQYVIGAVWHDGHYGYHS